MPRHNHPRERAKHTREHTRHHAKRVAKKRYTRAKQQFAGYGYTTQSYEYEPRGRWFRRVGSIAPYFMHPDEIRAKSRSASFPGSWPFYLSENEWARNPFTRCSCEGCSGERYGKEGRRQNRQIAEDAFSEYLDDPENDL